MLLKRIAPVLVLLLWCAAATAKAGAPGAVTSGVKDSVENVLAIMQSPAYAAPGKQAERDRLIHAAIAGKFSWEEMSRRALGANWSRLTPAQQAEFVSVFNAFLERTYIAKVDMFLQEEKNFSLKNITYTAEAIEGPYALVESKIALQDDEIPLNYKLIKKNDGWVVYDMSIEGVSLVANYRTQFNELLTGGSVAQLIEQLKAKQGEAIMKKTAGPPAVQSTATP